MGFPDVVSRLTRLQDEGRKRAQRAAQLAQLAALTFSETVMLLRFIANSDLSPLEAFRQKYSVLGWANLLSQQYTWRSLGTDTTCVTKFQKNKQLYKERLSKHSVCTSGGGQSGGDTAEPPTEKRRELQEGKKEKKDDATGDKECPKHDELCGDDEISAEGIIDAGQGDAVMDGVLSADDATSFAATPVASVQTVDGFLLRFKC